jgi:hypothetical protein
MQPLWKINENTVERADGTVVRECSDVTEARRYMESLVDALTRAAKAPITMKVGDQEKYPISDQKSANSAWKLRGHGKGVSKEAVEAHVGRAVKALGLKHPRDLMGDDNDD